MFWWVCGACFGRYAVLILVGIHAIYWPYIGDPSKHAGFRQKPGIVVKKAQSALLLIGPFLSWPTSLLILRPGWPPSPAGKAAVSKGMEPGEDAQGFY